MVRGTLARFAFLGVAQVLLFAGTVAAQQGTLTGTVTDREFGTAVQQAAVQVQGGPSVLTDNQGRFTVSLPAGSYTVVFTVVGYRSTSATVSIDAGQTTVLDVVIESAAFVLDPVVVTTSRTQIGEKASDSPATTVAVSSTEITERPAPALVEHLRSAPGVDIISYGVQSSNVTVRGFNNIFSGSLHMLTDNRLAGVPSLRVNLMHFIPTTEADIDRMEVVLGPGSALYGPNTANGVVHIITKSPLQEQGTSVTLGAGQQSVFQGSFRSAFLLRDDLGVKISGQYLQGDEWEFIDPTEAANRMSADSFPDLCLADKALRGITGAAAQLACDRVGIRDFDIERYGLEARADWRFADSGTLIATYGRNSSSGIELTGLGAGQAEEWIYQFFQARASYDRFFAQAYLNTSDAGGSYLLNAGVPLVDRSKLYVAQAQHGFSVADGRQDFTYGVDYFGTRPDTEGQINGRYENEDDIDEWGFYLQSKTALSPWLDLIVAGRIDDHSILPERVFSPRAALVFKPDEDQSIRVMYNQAYSSPSTLNYFLDISNGFAPEVGILGFGLRANGTGREGWSLFDGAGQLHGFRSPFFTDPSAMLPLGAATNFWAAPVGVLQQRVASGDLPASLAPVLEMLAGLTPTPADIGADLFDLSTRQVVPSANASSVVRDVPAIEEGNTETYEIGWTGILDDRVKLTADVYYAKKNNFTSPLLVQTPLVTFNGAGVGAFIGPPVFQFFYDQFVAAGMDPADAQVAAQQQAAVVVPQLAEGIARVPIGVLSNPDFSGGSDLVVSYRNVGDLSLWGSDFAMQWFLDDQWTLGGSYSWVSDHTFEIDDGDPISLNAPKHKGSVSLAYRNLFNGVNGTVRFRFNSGFPAVSAGFDGDVPSTKVVDMGLGYRIPRSPATVQLAVNNVFDSDAYAFVGVPSMGRFAMLKVHYQLF